MQIVLDGKVHDHAQAGARHHQPEGRVLHSLQAQRGKAPGQNLSRISFQYGTLTFMNLCFNLCHSFAYLMKAASKLLETNCNKQENQVDLVYPDIYIYIYIS